MVGVVIYVASTIAFLFILLVIRELVQGFVREWWDTVTYDRRIRRAVKRSYRRR